MLQPHHLAATALLSPLVPPLALRPARSFLLHLHEMTGSEIPGSGRTPFYGHGAVDHILQRFAAKYRGDAYHLVRCNCNHFTSQLAQVRSLPDLPLPHCLGFYLILLLQDRMRLDSLRQRLNGRRWWARQFPPT